MSTDPEILDEAAIADDDVRRQPSRAAVEAPDSALERRGPVDLMQVPRALGNALADIRTIAEGMAVLPKVLVTLTGIQDQVRELNDEVTRMRRAVEGMGGDVGELRGGIERLEPHLEDVSRVAHPLRRLSGRHRPNSGS